MALTSLWYPVITVALCMVLAAVMARGNWVPASAGTTAAAGGRFETIDGLRGFLALGVFFLHVMATYSFYAQGRWSAAFAPLHFAMGEAGVSIFFMITGFLFWRRVLRSKGAFDARALFVSRLNRLVPMYLFSVALVLLVVAVMSGFALREAPIAFLRELRPWLSFGFMTTGDLNGVRDAHIINAVYWTLAFEWAFYIALPLLALFARGAAFALLAALVVYFGIQAPIVLNFLGGALAAAAFERGWLNGRLAKWWLAPVPLALLAVALMREEVYAPGPIALLFVFFLFVVDGNSLFGLLRAKASQLLGTVSYSIYLLHCIVLFVFFRLAHAIVPVDRLTAAQHWTIAILAALATTALSVFTYRHVEHPFLARKKPGTDPGFPSAGTASPAVENRGLSPVSSP
jgi:peptidoglycan/LPS O-acetylase OafA/YrhL